MSASQPTTPPDPRLALGEELSALVAASRALTERSAARFHPALRPAAFHLARWLFDFGPAKPSVLAAEVAMDRGSTSNLIRQMKDHGLIDTTTDPTDRRSTIVSLTERGRTQVSAALDLRGSEFYQRVADWPADDISALAALLHRFNRPETAAGR
ncbi:MarR family winged helix-turn-helix transcriptional regulator [Frondihabitans australicus]|uniref:DNA-binding MarR family transcriptional regulator n=1 Tax=Frondihabitans australicus TaxID=386892 RepID=A0A495IK46_9MICO|nr:MarR family transcriptional regulator [Frondihabitans australicus]RKR76354.1 DNA-binding MarR family transcriptional regulator [Frondihabitans australicus]